MVGEEKREQCTYLWVHVGTLQCQCDGIICLINSALRRSGLATGIGAGSGGNSDSAGRLSHAQVGEDRSHGVVLIALITPDHRIVLITLVTPDHRVVLIALGRSAACQTRHLADEFSPCGVVLLPWYELRQRPLRWQLVVQRHVLGLGVEVKQLLLLCRDGFLEVEKTL